MGYKIRRSKDRKYFDHGWLKTYHTFSFGSYYDPQFMGFRDLRVINEDRVKPDSGFPTHSHSDMEIISIVLEGSLAHRDSMGNESIIPTNSVQVMSAGTGVTHSEYNPSRETVHFLQIWIVPDSMGVFPRYGETKLPTEHNQWVLIASKSGINSSLQIHQDVNLYTITIDKGYGVEIKILSHRYGWIQVIEGDIVMNEDILTSGDGAAIDNNTVLNIQAKTTSRLLFFDLT